MKRLKRWGGGGVVRWQGGKGVRRARWERWEVPGLFKGEDAGWVQDFMFLFLMLIKGTKEQDGLKIYLCGRRDGKNRLKPSTNCQKLSGVWGYVKFVVTCWSKLKMLTLWYKILLVVISKSWLWWFYSYWGGLRLRKGTAFMFPWTCFGGWEGRRAIRSACTFRVLDDRLKCRKMG